MNRSSQGNITAVPATNISVEKMNTKVEVSRSSQDNITPVPVTNIPDEEIDTKVSINN